MGASVNLPTQAEEDGVSDEFAQFPKAVHRCVLGCIKDVQSAFVNHRFSADADFLTQALYDEICSICQQKLVHNPGYSAAILTPCLHTMHAECIQESIKHLNNTCPECRGNIGGIRPLSALVASPTFQAQWARADHPDTCLDISDYYCRFLDDDEKKERKRPQCNVLGVAWDAAANPYDPCWVLFSDKCQQHLARTHPLGLVILCVERDDGQHVFFLLNLHAFWQLRVVPVWARQRVLHKQPATDCAGGAPSSVWQVTRPTASSPRNPVTALLPSPQRPLSTAAVVAENSTLVLTSPEQLAITQAEEVGSPLVALVDADRNSVLGTPFDTLHQLGQDDEMPFHLWMGHLPLGRATAMRAARDSRGCLCIRRLSQL